MGSNFTIQELQDDHRIEKVLSDILLTCIELDFDYAMYVEEQKSLGQPVLPRLQWIEAESNQALS